MTDITSATEVMSTSWVKFLTPRRREYRIWRGIPIILSHTPRMWEMGGGGVENPVDVILLKVFFDRRIICF